MPQSCSAISVLDFIWLERRSPCRWYETLFTLRIFRSSSRYTRHHSHMPRSGPRTASRKARNIGATDLVQAHDGVGGDSVVAALLRDEVF